jgi:putative membrane protein
MGRLLLRWILMAATVIIVGYVETAVGLNFRTDVQTGGSVVQVFIGVAILALVNATLGRVVKFLTIPLNCLTLGLFSIVVNAIMLMWVASLNIGFHLAGKGMSTFVSALIASILISTVNGALGGIFLPDEDKK